jgi:hypothetical protein
MIKYPILRWDAIITGDVNQKAPMIYISPDLDFLEFAEANSNQVYVEISGTGLSSDGILIPGTVNKSCNVPNPRPNYFAQTGQYVIILHTHWAGYPRPSSLGHATFKGLRTVDVADVMDAEDLMGSEDLMDAEDVMDANMDKTDGGNSLTTCQIVGLIALILVILATIVYMNMNSKQTRHHQHHQHHQHNTKHVFY